ncbi:MAG: hypothetical protein KAV00_10190 [Phycisphaerae bacterium]|nr:hypothetical protein [Phycisphaerae bacterium]
MIIEKAARETLTAVELDIGDELVFILTDGSKRSIVLEKTWAEVHETTLKQVGVAEFGGRTVCRFHCQLRIEGQQIQLSRWVGNQRSFYRPWELFGMRIWFDAATDLFDFLVETHGDCKPRKQARFALQDAQRRICPVLLHAWCPLPEHRLRIEDCYDGGDCWMGPYFGAEAHGGLDINHPAGTPIWSPIDIDDHHMFNSLDAGDNNNRWRGRHRWPDGSVWTIQVSHLIRLLVPEGQPFPAGTHYAEGAGMHIGSYEHSHFVFKVREPETDEGEDILLDPWILFRQIYEDRRATMARRD